jgi:Cu-Zn family superoxide dismutase
MFKFLLAVTCLTTATIAFADITVTMHSTSETGAKTLLGTVEVQETKYGLLFTPNLHGLSPGIHGFHIHQNPTCDNNGMAAGDHFDPNHTGKHLGPYNDLGHLGDLPALSVNSEGLATLPVLAPRLKHISEIQDHSLMIHAGGDNYSDKPKKTGGGGMRMICGVIK